MPNAREAGVCIEKTSTTSRYGFRSRAEVNQSSTFQASTQAGTVRLRLERKGQEFIGYVSQTLDPPAWIEFQRKTLAVSGDAPLLVGIAATARDAGEEHQSLPALEARVCDVRLEVAPRFIRGNCNGDGVVDISDAICILEWLFLGTSLPPCVAATNANGDGAADVSDPISLLEFLFLRNQPPADPYPKCGAGNLPADESLGCKLPPENCN